MKSEETFTKAIEVISEFLLDGKGKGIARGLATEVLYRLDKAGLKVVKKPTTPKAAKAGET